MGLQKFDGRKKSRLTKTWPGLLPKNIVSNEAFGKKGNWGRKTKHFTTKGGVGGKVQVDSPAELQRKKKAS